MAMSNSNSPGFVQVFENANKKSWRSVFVPLLNKMLLNTTVLNSRQPSLVQRFRGFRRSPRKGGTLSSSTGKTHKTAALRDHPPRIQHSSANAKTLSAESHVVMTGTGQIPGFCFTDATLDNSDTTSRECLASLDQCQDVTAVSRLEGTLFARLLVAWPSRLSLHA